MGREAEAVIAQTSAERQVTGDDDRRGATKAATGLMFHV